MATRLFLMGVIALFFGAQLRSVETFVVNERVSGLINRRAIEASETRQLEASLMDRYSYGFEAPKSVKKLAAPKFHRISPPRWLGWSFLSIGAVLTITSPLFRR